MKRVIINTGKIALVFRRGNYKRVLTEGTYWMRPAAQVLQYDLARPFHPSIDLNILLKDKELAGHLHVVEVADHEIALQLEISGQEILTKDKAALRVNFYTQYKVVDMIKAINDNKDYEKQLYIIIQLALREYIGTLTLDEILGKKESIATYVMTALKEKAGALGVAIKDCGVRDIILPGDMKEIMNQVLVAEKKAQANVITRREETASTRSLLNTAKIMEENEMLFKLKEMEYVEKIADKINSISLSGGNQILTQLKEIFSSPK